MISSSQSDCPGRAVLLLSVQPQPKDPAQKHPERSALGSPAAGRHGHHSLPADHPPQTREGGKQHSCARPLLKDRHRRRRRLLAKHRHQVSSAGLAASAGDQLRHRDQCLRLQGRRSGRDLGRARRGRTGESTTSGNIKLQLKPICFLLELTHLLCGSTRPKYLTPHQETKLK